MSDLFLDALVVKTAHHPGKGAVKAVTPPERKPLQVVGPLYKPGTRPSFADDIDRIVADMVARGDVYLDDNVYRCRKRSWRMEGR